jgi:hypothetical protein
MKLFLHQCIGFFFLKFEIDLMNEIPKSIVNKL